MSRTVSWQGTACNAWGSHTAVTHPDSLREKLFKNILAPSCHSSCLCCTSLFPSLCHYTVCRAFSTRRGNDALKTETTPQSPQLLLGRFLNSDRFHDLHYDVV